MKGTQRHNHDLSLSLLYYHLQCFWLSSHALMVHSIYGQIVFSPSTLVLLLDCDKFGKIWLSFSLSVSEFGVSMMVVTWYAMHGGGLVGNGSGMKKVVSSIIISSLKLVNISFLPLESIHV